MTSTPRASIPEVCAEATSAPLPHPEPITPPLPVVPAPRQDPPAEAAEGKRKPKGKKDEVRNTVVPLSAGVLRVLKVAKEITGHTEYVVANLATGLAQTNPQKAFNRINKKVGLKERWTRHDIRHTVSTNLGRLKIEPHIIDRVLHHRTAKASIHHRYNQWEYLDQKREALDAWGSFLDGLVVKKSA